jgi:hypothetical protein
MGKAMGERRASTSYPENGRERGRGREGFRDDAKGVGGVYASFSTSDKQNHGRSAPSSSLYNAHTPKQFP